MTNNRAGEVRIKRTRVELQGSQNDIDAWLKKRRQADKLQRHHTQLLVLEHQLKEGLRRLEHDLSNLASAEVTLGRIYRGCRETEGRLAWLQRVWLYFRRKFDQREGATETLLAAADEMVWSCFAPAFQYRGQAIPSAPLPYLEPLYSPNTQPRTRRPPELELDVDHPFVQQCLENLPIPVISIPPSCVESPWWLVFIAHEVGHNLQHDFLPSKSLVIRFAELLKEKAGDRWFARGEEVFADVVSVLCCGTAPIRALFEFVFNDEPEFFSTSRAAYPPARIRLEMMCELARQLGLSVAAALPDYRYVSEPDKAGTPQQAEKEQAMALVAVIRTFKPDGANTLEDLIGFQASEFASAGSIKGWMNSLWQWQDPVASSHTESARLMMTAGVQVWDALLKQQLGEAAVQEQSKKGLTDLSERLPRAVLASRVGGTRADTPRVVPVTALAVALSDAPLDEFL